MRTDTRMRMIETTARLVQARGLHGVSLSEILRESDAPRGSLYFHFPGGKSELILEAVRSGIEEASEALRACLDGADNPAEGVRDFFRIVARELVDSDYVFGCPVAGVVLDRPEIGSELERTCQAALDQWGRMYREAFLAAGMAPDRAERLAMTVLAGLEGALMMARSEQRPTAIEGVGEEVSRLIADALPPRNAGVS
ncbi:MAG: TetR/AcrR family transcriptional regulator [Ectothiorhodospiraceae bacterium]|nr:TetR/AcrR family transcriptional regulator [Ectothiorhodospiraceae bacterium]